jgi:hypothetical protein
MASSAAAGNRRNWRIANPPQDTILPHIAASRNEWWRFSAVVGGESKGGRRIDNPPQIVNLPHNSSRQAKKMTVSSTEDGVLRE